MGGAVGKLVSTVTKPLGSALGGVQSGISQTGPQSYKGQSVAIDPNAYKIGNLGNIYSEQSGQRENAKKQAELQAALAAQAAGQQQTSRAQILASMDQQGQARQTQGNFIQQLQQQAAGQGPSLAMATLKASQDKSLKQQLAAAASQRGGNQAALQRALLYSQAQQGGELGQQAMQGRVQEQLNAQGQLGNAIQQQRAQDLSNTDQYAALRGQDIGLQQNASQNQLAQQGLEGQYLANEFNIQSAAQKAAADQQNANIQQNLAVQGLNASGVAAQNQAAAATTGGLLSGIGSAIGLSDKNKKADIKSESGEKYRGAQEEYEEEQDKKKKIAGEGIKSAVIGSLHKASDSWSKSTDYGANVAEKATASFSDKNSKENIKAEKDDKFTPKHFLDALKAYSFEYKDSAKNLPGAGNGRYLGVMAQDLEKAGPVGQSMVQNTPEGKKVDFGKGLGAMLASQADLNDRLSAVESGYEKVLKAKQKKK